MKKTRKNTDDRMQWILALEEYKENKGKKVYFTEYEICSEVRIPGVLDYGSGFLQCHIFQEANKDGLYTYILRIKHIRKEYKFNLNNFSKKGYYFESGLAGELLAIFSVYFQARFYLKATITGKSPKDTIGFRSEEEFQYRKPGLFLNFEMFSDQKRNWADTGLKSFLDTVKTLDPKYHQKLIQSFHWYAQAIKEIGVDHQLFFIKMVSAVESLLNFIGFTHDNLEKKLNLLINDGKFAKKESEEIKNWLKNRGIKRKFTAFLKKYSEGFFKKGRRKAKHCHIRETELADYAKRIYNARSAYLHEGRPMYRSFDTNMEDAKYWDLDLSQGMMVDRKRFAANEKLPRVRWFERLVNQCLKNFIENNKRKPKWMITKKKIINF